jgi:hypothetical protein
VIAAVRRMVVGSTTLIIVSNLALVGLGRMSIPGLWLE